MPTLVPISFAGAGTAFSIGGIGDNMYLLPDRYLISTDGIGVRAFSDNALDIHGAVHGFEYGLLMGEEVSGGSVYIGDTGSVSASTYSAITGYGGVNGFFNDYAITNNGEIVTQDPSGASSTGVAATIYLVNNTNAADPAEIAATFSVVNSGLIANEGFGLRTHAIRFDQVTEHAQIHNAADGIISNVADGIAAIQVGGVGYLDAETGEPARTTVEVLNAGTIFSAGLAYESVEMHESGQERLALDRFVNTGEVFGDISLGTGTDSYKGRDGYVDGVVYGGDGDDVLVGGGIADHLDGGRDNDLIRGGAGNDYLDGGIGPGNDSIYGGEGNDTIDGKGGDDILFGYAGDDVIEGGFGTDLIRGGAGNDLLEGSGGSDTLNGGDGDDIVGGGRGQDLVRGGDGDDDLTGFTESDTLEGGQGNDRLSGGAQDDTFVFDFDGGHDVVTDYDDGSDVFDVSALYFNGFAVDIQPFLVQSGADVILDFSFGALTQTVTIENEVTGNIDATDFIL